MSNIFFAACRLPLAAWPGSTAQRNRSTVGSVRLAARPRSPAQGKQTPGPVCLGTIIYMGFYLTVSSFFDKNNLNQRKE